MKNFTILVTICAKSQGEAEKARDEMAQSLEDARDSNVFDSTTDVMVGDVEEAA